MWIIDNKWLTIGVIAGSLIAGVQRHPRRLLGMIPYAMLLLIYATVCRGAEYLIQHKSRDGQPSPHLFADYAVLATLFGIGIGMLFVILCSSLLNRLISIQSWRSFRQLMSILFSVVAALSLCWLLDQWYATDIRITYLSLIALAAILLVLAFLPWVVFFNQAIEQLLEIILLPIYRIYAYGPGVRNFPRKGPVLVVANHAAWLDPLWVAKVVPRRVFPMMTSAFYDLPFMSWLMKRVVGAIRVEASGFRREVPELQEAIGVLDRNSCLLLFPEGKMRRSEDKLLSMFGQGVWHILTKRPDVPVVVCWIEGGWGSFFSYWKGKPTKNKRMDFWHSIKVAMTEPQILSEEILADHRKTRTYLMECCLAARQLLGLPIIAVSSEETEEVTE